MGDDGWVQRDVVEFAMDGRRFSGERMGMSGRRARRTRESRRRGNSGSTLRSRGKAAEEKFRDGVRMSVGNLMGGAGIFHGDVGNEVAFPTGERVKED